jgi:hypothetical protein
MTVFTIKEIQLKTTIFLIPYPPLINLGVYHLAHMCMYASDVILLLQFHLPFGQQESHLHISHTRQTYFKKKFTFYTNFI